MRVRPKRQAEPRRTLALRRRSGEPAHERQAAPADGATAAADPGSDGAEGSAAGELRAERRMRASGGPEDHALYRCGCGFAFEAAVSTSVACPHCGAGQAW